MQLLLLLLIVVVLLASSSGSRRSNNVGDDAQLPEPRITNAKDVWAAAQDDAFKKQKDAILDEIRLELRKLRKANDQKLSQISKDITSEVKQQIRQLSKNVERTSAEVQQLRSDLKRGTLTFTNLALRPRNVTARLGNCTQVKRKQTSKMGLKQRQRTNAPDRGKEELPTSLPKAAEPGCVVNVTATDVIMDRVVNDSCLWTFTAADGRDVLLVVQNSTTDCRGGALEIRTEGRTIPDICRRVETGAVVQPLAGLTIAVRYRRAPSSPAPAMIGLRYRARANVSTLRLVIQSPAVWFSSRNKLRLRRGERTWGDIRQRARRMSPSRFDGLTLAVNFGWLFRRGPAVRRFVYCQGGWRDELDGRVAPRQGRVQYFYHFLLPNSDIQTCPGCVPVLQLFLSSQVVEVTAADPPRLRSTGAASLLDPSFVLMLWGKEMTDLRNNASKVFLLTADSGVADAHTGCYLPSGSSIVAAQTTPLQHQKWRRLFIVLRRGDAIPKFAVAPGRPVGVLTRFGVHLSVERGRLRQRGRANPRDGTWVQMRRGRNAIAEQVTRAMRCCPPPRCGRGGGVQ